MTGARASWTFSDALTVRAGIYSGWDRVIDDNNGSRTALFQAEWAVTDKLFLNFQYMFGVERDRSAREGPWVRHTFDHWGEFEVTSRLQVRWHAFAGVEPNRLGVSAWAGVAAYARFKFFDWLFAATRFEVLHEWVPAGSRSMFDLNDATTLGDPHRRGAPYRISRARGVPPRPCQRLALLPRRRAQRPHVRRAHRQRELAGHPLPRRHRLVLTARSGVS